MRSNQIVVPFLFFLLLLGCSNYDDYLYEVIDLEATNSDNASNGTINILSDSIPMKSYLIRLQFTMEYKGETGNKSDKYESGYRNEYEINSFNVYSLEQFDALHPAGASLNEYFLVRQRYYYDSESTIQSMIDKNEIGGGIGYREELEGTWTTNRQALILMQPPSAAGKYSFVIDIEQSNNTQLIDTVTITLY